MAKSLGQKASGTPPARRRSLPSPGPGSLLDDFLRSLPATGEVGFEGLVAEILTAETGRTFRLQRSGSQAGRDAETERGAGAILSMEAKHYFGRPPALRELLGELAEVAQLDPPVDLWILATTAFVPPTHSRAIDEETRTRGFDWFALDADPEGPRLLWLLAAHGEVVLAFAERHHLSADRTVLAGALHAIREASGFADRLARLKTALHEKILGFVDAAARVHAAILRALRSPPEMRRGFHQDVAVRAPGREIVPRTGISAALDAWLRDVAATGRHAAVLGEEGTGKTWAALAWTADLLERGAEDWLVLPISASATRIGEGETIEDVLPRALARWIGDEEERWKGRLGRWLDGRGPTGPRLLVILDGLNERTDLRWAAILSKLEEPAWAGRVAAIVVDRPVHWDEECAPKLGAPFHRLPVEGYTREELLRALRIHGVDPAEVPSDLDDLIRLPRYCGLVCRHFEAMAESGDFTRARVIYLDLRDRAASRTSYPLSDRELQDLIVEAARLHRASRDGVPEREIAALVPGTDRERDVVAELRTSGVMVAVAGSTGRYRVEPVRLAYAMGLLLAEDVSRRAREGASEAEVAEAIARWFEPEPDADLKVEAAAAALFHTTLEPTRHPAVTRRALLHYWLRLRNWDDRSRIAILGYVLRIPGDFVAVAERLWSGGSGAGAGQDFLSRAFATYRDDPAVLPVLVAAAERWLGFVHGEGHPFSRPRGGQAGFGPQPEEIRSRFEAVTAAGSATSDIGVNLTMIVEDGPLRLRSLALGIMQSGSRLPFTGAILAWAVSSAVMGYAPETDDIAWAARLTDEDLDPPLLAAARTLVDGHPAEIEAARHVLRALGTEAAGLLAALHPEPPHEGFLELRREHEADPCRGPFRLAERDCEVCLAREDIAVGELIGTCERYFLDPDAALPVAFLDRAAAELACVDPSAFRASLSRTIEDHRRERLETVLAGRRPGPLAAFYEGVVASLADRSSESAVQAGQDVPEFAPLLSRESVPALLAAVARLDEAYPDRHASGGAGSEMVGTACLFAGVLPLLDPDERAEHLLQRADGVFDLQNCEEWNGGLGPARRNAILAILDDPASSPTQLIRCLTLLGANAGHTPGFGKRLLRLASHEDDHVRGVALRVGYLLGEEDVGHDLADLARPLEVADRRGLEEGYGSSLLAMYGGHLPLRDLALRLHPAALTHALASQPREEADLHLAGKFLEKAWARVAEAQLTRTGEPPRVTGLPSAETAGMGWPEVSTEEAEDGGAGVPPDRSGRPSPRQRDREWEAFLQRQAERDRVLEEAWRTDAFGWYAAAFSADGLERVVRARPDLAERWARAVVDDRTNPRLRLRLHGFNGPLATAMFQAGHPLALPLWRALFGSPSSGEEVARVAFDAPDGGDADLAREAVLLAAGSDAALQAVALQAIWCGRGAWVDGLVGRWLRGGPSWRKAVALTLVSFSDVTPTRFDEVVAEAGIVGTWVESRVEDLRARVVANAHAKEWYRLFCSAEDTMVAWGAFRMVLATGDGRFGAWRDEAEGGMTGAWKRPFVACNASKLSSAFRKRAGPDDKLFGRKVPRGGAPFYAPT